jgi:hypothetical protein
LNCCIRGKRCRNPSFAPVGSFLSVAPTAGTYDQYVRWLVTQNEFSGTVLLAYLGAKTRRAVRR